MPRAKTSDDPREELADIAASLRAYVEQQLDSGAHGSPRAPRRAFAQPAQPPQPEATAPIAAPRAAEPTAQAPAPAAEAPERAPAAPRGPSPERHARLPQLAAQVAECTRCPLHAGRTKTVFSRGNPDARLCFIGEAPGADEDAQGVPFVGRAGQLLDRMIMAMGLSPERDVYICNIIKCRPPENRRPTPEEMATCMPFLDEQLALIAPEVIVAMGNTAVQGLLDTKVGITKVRGSWRLLKGKIELMPTYHPSYLLRPSAQQFEAKKQVWEDLQQVMKRLGLPMPAPSPSGAKPR